MQDHILEQSETKLGEVYPYFSLRPDGEFQATAQRGRTGAEPVGNHAGEAEQD